MIGEATMALSGLDEVIIGGEDWECLGTGMGGIRGKVGVIDFLI
jgi:hypothetical protein